VPGLAGNW